MRLVVWALAIAVSLPITRQGVVAATASPAFILHNKRNNPRRIKQSAYYELILPCNQIIVTSRLFSLSSSSNDIGTNEVAEAVTATTTSSTTGINNPTMTLYEILNISSTATRAEVKQSYLALAKETHPDALLLQQQQQISSSSSSISTTINSKQQNDSILNNNNIQIKHTFTDIAKAYQILYDPILRKRYDRTLTAKQISNQASTILNKFMNNAVMKLDSVLPLTDVDGGVVVEGEGVSQENIDGSLVSRSKTLQQQVPPIAVPTMSSAIATANVFETIINSRYACTRFQRHDDDTSSSTQSSSTTTTAAPHGLSIVQLAYQCLQLSTRSPTGFNAQPYRVILVHSQQDKTKVAQYCLGRNADRVRDSHCTAIFVADGECGREWGTKHVDLLNNTRRRSSATVTTQQQQSSSLSSRGLLKLRLLILLFSSGYPLPRFIRVPLSSFIRLGVSIVGGFARLLKRYTKYNNIQLLPSLVSSETWSQKNTMLIAMSYMLACTSYGLATCPMEGYDARGIKKALGITPSGRYSIPLIVSTGLPYYQQMTTTRDEKDDETDDVGLCHGREQENMSPRYPIENVIFGNTFGTPAIDTFS
jgi:curved DNA-binding protein CbpA